MTSPEPGTYPHLQQHHHNPHPHLSHLYPPPPQDQQLQAPPVAPLPPPAAPHQNEGVVVGGHEVYSGDHRPYHHHQHYPERRSPFPPPPPPPPPHSETEQPLDLSLSRSPRPPSAGSLASEGGEGPPLLPKRPRLEEGVSRGEMEVTRGGDPHSHPHHSSVCLVRSCHCRSPLPVHHTPHYSHHRHSPYPQYPVSGHSSPGLPPQQQQPLADVQAYPHHPYSIPQPPPPSSSPGLMYGVGGGSSAGGAAGGGGGGGSSPYIPPLPPPDRRSRSPGMMGVGMSYGGEMMPQRASPGTPLLGPAPPHPVPPASISPLSVSTHARGDSSPCPPPPPPAPPSFSQSLARMRDVSPRPFYRPFEDVGHGLADMPHAAPVITSSSGSGGDRTSAMEPYPSEDDLSASSTLLMLSNTTGEGRPSMLTTRHMADSSADTFRPQEPFPHHHQQPGVLRENKGLGREAEPSQSDSGRARLFRHLSAHPGLLSHAAPKVVDSQGIREARSEASSSSSSSSSYHPVGPAQDSTVASSFPSDDLNDSPSPRQEDSRRGGRYPQAVTTMTSRADCVSPKQDKAGGKDLQSRVVKVVGTTPLAALREQRAKKQAEKVKELFEHHADRFAANNSNDSEGASDINSSGQASPRSSDGSDNDVGQGFPIPPDPNIKMSALDYLISKVLVERIDVPFKACNTEIQEIYTGARKGRLTLVDLIELQVEASLKA